MKIESHRHPTADEKIVASWKLSKDPPAPRPDPQTAGQFAANLHASEWAIAHNPGAIYVVPPPPRQVAEDPAQREIDEMEAKINLIQSEISGMESSDTVAGGIRGLRFARQHSNRAAERARIDLILADLIPPYEAKLAELSALRAAHKDAITRRQPEKNLIRLFSPSITL
jgi:hypothetical protein